MATETKREQAQKKRSAGEILTGVLDAARTASAPQFADFLKAVSDEVGIKELATAFAKEFRDGSPVLRRRLVVDYATMLRQFQEMMGEPTRDEISKMTDQVLDANIVELLGFEKINDNGSDESETGNGTGTPDPDDLRRAVGI